MAWFHVGDLPVSICGYTTAVIDRAPYLGTSPLHAGFCAGKGDVEPLSKFLLGEALILRKQQCLAVWLG